jgi:hypothetical protein
MSRVLSCLTIGFLLTLIVPSVADPHNGELDVYGCHYDKERKDYHCHQGMFKGGSFDSKMEMIRRLRRQYLDLGRPWPYGAIDEEDITTSPPPESPEKEK